MLHVVDKDSKAVIRNLFLKRTTVFNEFKYDDNDSKLENLEEGREYF